MIVFDLQCCDGGETFEAWFRSGADFEDQSGKALVECPYCGSSNVRKAPMAPRVPPKHSNALARLAAMQAELLAESRWVGDAFADTARAMHCGEAEPELVHGQVTFAQAKSLCDDGVPIAPLPLPVVPPQQLN
jgi:hypothetical protein